MDIYTLVKLIYILDRESYRRWGYAVTYDKYASLPFGPVPSNTYDLLKCEKGSEWNEYLSRNGNSVKLIKSIDRFGKLSKAIKDLIAELYDRYGQMNFDELKEITHSFPEFQDPGNRSSPISTRSLIEAVVEDKNEVHNILQDLREQAKCERLIKLYA